MITVTVPLLGLNVGLYAKMSVRETAVPVSVCFRRIWHLLVDNELSKRAHPYAINSNETWFHHMLSCLYRWTVVGQLPKKRIWNMKHQWPIRILLKIRDFIFPTSLPEQVLLLISAFFLLLQFRCHKSPSKTTISVLCFALGPLGLFHSSFRRNRYTVYNMWPVEVEMKRRLLRYLLTLTKIWHPYKHTISGGRFISSVRPRGHRLGLRTVTCKSIPISAFGVLLRNSSKSVEGSRAFFKSLAWDII